MKLHLKYTSIIWLLFSFLLEVTSSQEQEYESQINSYNGQSEAGYGSGWNTSLHSYYQSSSSKTSGVKGTKTSGVKGTKTSGVKGTKTNGVKETQIQPQQTVGFEDITFEGGCTSRPVTPQNSKLYCLSYSGCRITCHQDYRFPTGEVQIYMKCVGGEWQIENTEWEVAPHCEPICEPPCANGGMCIAPHQCKCPQNYGGVRCEHERMPCLNYPPLPTNSRRICNKRTCTVQCAEGYQFPDGSAVTNMLCSGGKWVPSRKDWTSIPNCDAICEPECENGGVCLTADFCQCPQGFRGPRCQYSDDACTVGKLKFNGGYKCSGSSETLTCSISCPTGATFEYPPVDKYVCHYSDGFFTPEPPQCVFPGNDVEIIPGSSQHSHRITSSSSHSHISSVHRVNVTWSQVSGTSSNSNSWSSSSHHRFGSNNYRPSPGFCYSWGQDHYKTFDGKILSFQSDCSYTLVHDVVDNTFSINMEPKKNHKNVVLFQQDKKYTLTLNDQGVPILIVGSRQFSVPLRLSGITVDFLSHFIELTATTLGVTVLWDEKNFISVNVMENMWNKTVGLCGRLDGYMDNDMEAKSGSVPRRLTTFVDSWKADSLGEVCQSTVSEEHPCNSLEGSAYELGAAATQFCSVLLTDPQFSMCKNILNAELYYEACRWDYCSCPSTDHSTCACESMSVYARECKRLGTDYIGNWRNNSTCPITCSGGRVYQSCGPAVQQTCSSTSDDIPTKSEKCEEGCYCPEGTILHEGRCISKSECPCQLRGKSFSPGESVPKECNTCTCTNGQWICTKAHCTARCSAVGDPHYITFDGRHFDFMGKCSYYLIKGDNYSVETENVACAGAVSQVLGFVGTSVSSYPSCTKTITIRLGERFIKLKQNKEVSANGRDIAHMPFTMDGATVRIGSSIFLIVELPNGLEIFWDGFSRIFIDAPASLQGTTKGLCGTFNLNQKDDFLTPEGDIEQTPVSFANKWKTQDVCEDTINKVSDHPCDINIHNKATAEKYCSKLKGTLFQDCHWTVNYETYYEDCLYDLCSCEGGIGQCLCPILAAYAKECSDKGVIVDFRSDVLECAVSCPASQKYQVCGNSCTRSCYDIAHNSQCKRQCIEGCNCIEGQTLDSNGECIPIEQCPCQSNNIEYPAGHKEIRPGSKGLQLCVCTNAAWNCKLATYNEIEHYPVSGNVSCSAARNEELTVCEPEEPVTCKNMHNPPQYSPAVCTPGCKCKKGYVLDIQTKKCVSPKECPCHHGGKSYGEGSSIQEDCNTCQCKAGMWECTDKPCAAICTAWGDSHFKTFDGKIYDFQGTCDYVLAKGNLGNNDVFDISIYNVPCGTSGVTCSKSVTLKVGTGEKQDVITFTKDEPLPSFVGFDRITIREAGLFVFVDVYDMKLTLQWDRATRLYVKIDPQWKNKVKGLCGNYNDNDMDDFQTPSGGISEVSPVLFGDSWKLQPQCPNSLDVKDTCLKHPNRKVWALQKCGILKSSVFQPCHSEVPVEPYLERCIFDSCACDFGGDCECLCTAIAAYAQECNIHGVPIKWRSQELCPIQCDESCSHYSPCIKTCPKLTCDNHLIYKSISPSCHEDSCVEGCEVKPCPPGEVYFNLTTLKCVPLNECPSLCLQIGDVIYKEGDIIEQDHCHTCHCSRSRKICQGKPCPGVSVLPSTTAPPPLSGYLCRPGWTSWINSNVPGNSKIENEPPPSVDSLFNVKSAGVCKEDDMTSIECREVGTHLSYEHYKEKEYNVTCSLEMNGLQCWGVCPDFEIRVFCSCVGSEKPTTEQPTTPPRNGRYDDTTVKTSYISESSSTIKPDITTQQPPQCDVTRPNHPDPTDCYIFYQCVPTLTGSQYVKKTCGPSMMYNPNTMTCDWIQTVMALRPECGRCTPGTFWNDCAYQCNQLCHHFEHESKRKGLCKSNHDCIPGCIPSNCPQGHFWRDESTCVHLDDCTCMSKEGNIAKPGLVIHEDLYPCEICQCLSNSYVCDNSTLCSTPHVATTPETLLPTTTTSVTMKTTLEPTKPEVTTQHISSTTVFIIPSTVTPPPVCETEFVPLLTGPHAIQSVSLDASSSLNKYFSPENAIGNITSSSAGSWTAAHQNQDQYLQVNLGEVDLVYGVIVRGSPVVDQYVTAYKVLYSLKGDRYTYVTDENNMPQIFRGPINNNDPAQQVFHHPIEAQYIRFNPQTWHDAISMRVELLGCGNGSVPVTTSQPVTSPRPKNECTDKMGLETGMVVDQQITASSSAKINGLPYEPSGARLHNTQYPGGWAPNIASENEWIQVNFIEPRNLSGIVTQGQSHGDSWVEAYKVTYSNDGKIWNPVLDTSGNKKIFSANFDSEAVHTNMFDRMIRAQFIRVIPVVWHNYPVLRFDVLGCYEPYSTLPPAYTQQVTTESTPLPVKCNLCPSLPHNLVDVDKCRLCEDNEWWDGEKCTSRVECPCFVNEIKYMVGAVFFSEDCQECRCELQGITKCEAKHTCGHCDKGLQSVLTPSCACVCKPCPPNTVLCPTSNICISESSWCDGIEDCPDDELNCTREVTTQTSTTVSEPTKPPEVECPPPKCPPGYELREIPKDKYANLEPMNDAPAKQPGIKGRTQKSAVKGRNRIKGHQSIKGRQGIKGQMQHGKPQNTTQCIPITKYECVVPRNETNCSKPTCPEGYTMIPVRHEEGVKKKCVDYICKPPAAVCEVSGRTFNTFDKTEYKYDACDHVLVRDRDDIVWEVVLLKNCSNGVTCSQQLSILDFDHEIIFYSDLGIKFDGYDYTPQQVERIGSQYSSFSLSQLGDSLYYESKLYGFRIKWDKESNVKIWVNGELAGHIDGLCGFFNGRREDDKLKPDGSSARTSVEFGDSWRNPRVPLACKVTQCPAAVQSQALEMCSSVRNKPLSLCQDVIKTEKFLSECIDFACSCLGTEESSQDECRCRVMQNYVTQCQAAEQSVDISSWRTQLNCPIFCPQQLVYKECYKHKCEASCENLREENPCPSVDNVCFPGCFCPDGLVRKGSSCVTPTECRDCICNGFGGSQYMSFDRSNFTFSGNCTYIAAQDQSHNNKHDFQVLVTNTECKHGSSSLCTTNITIVYENHTINMVHDKDKEQINFLLDQSKVEESPYNIGWLLVEGHHNTKLTLLIPKIQLEVSYVYSTYAFTIQLPSQLYGGKIEGLCGDCNYDQTNDFSSSDIVEPDINEFGTSWLYPSSENQKCGPIGPPPSCIVPPEQNICDKLLDLERFGKCHHIVDTESYIQACNNDICNSPDPIETACSIFASYASECLREAFECLDWRSDTFCPYKCHSGLEYHPCKTGCTETCENYEALRNNPEECQLFPTEGCFCSEKQILVNGTCIDISLCKVCDDEGHHSGDVWNPDACTTCTCKGNLRQCNKVECIPPDRVCDQSHNTPVLIKGTEQQCCPEYTCVPISTTPATCPELKKPECKPDQTLKLITQSNGCHIYVCECKAKDDCESLLGDEPVLPPGMVRVRNESGCCPHYNTLCDTSRCPTPPPCKKFYKAVTKPPGDNECCPHITCEPPEDACLYEFSYEAAQKGGEKERNVTDKFTVKKEPGSEWTDGPCRKCTCSGNEPGSYEVTCSVESCVTNNLDEEIKDYVLQETYTHNHCCPGITRLRCRDGEKIYQVNEKWPAHHDPCRTFVCAEMPDGSVKKEIMVTSCNETCGTGYFYEPPLAHECCGHCKQVSCVVDGNTYAENSEWETEDHCTKYKCRVVDNSLQVVGIVVNCPIISEDDNHDYEIQEIPVAGHCCKDFKKVKCKEGRSVYEIGTTWTSVKSSCLNISCVSDASSGQAQKVETHIKCIEECDKGWEYIPSTSHSYECCGKCVQVACVDDLGHLHKPGDVWKENCTSFECKQHLTQFQIISMHETCPPVENCPKDQLYPDNCCWKCNTTTGISRRNCQPEPLPEKMTVNLVYHHEKSHGNCTNLWPIANFNECRGNCESYTFYDPNTVHHESNCKCCQASEFQTVSVSLTCEDGYVLQRQLTVPSDCSCMNCGAGDKTTDNHSQQQTHIEVEPEVDFERVKGAEHTDNHSQQQTFSEVEPEVDFESVKGENH